MHVVDIPGMIWESLEDLFIMPDKSKYLLENVEKPTKKQKKLFDTINKEISKGLADLGELPIPVLPIMYLIMRLYALWFVWQRVTRPIRNYFRDKNIQFPHAYYFSLLKNQLENSIYFSARLAEKHFYQMISERITNHQVAEYAIYVSPEKNLTYLELNEQANRLANYLLHVKRLQPGVRIGLFFDYSCEYIVSVLATMKAGLTFVPLSTGTAKVRLDTYVEKTNIDFIISSSHLENNPFVLKLRKEVVYLDRLATELAKCSRQDPKHKVGLNQLAYIHNTSGITGMPKQVLIPFRGLYNCASDSINKLNITHESKVSAYSDLSFDAHLFEIMVTLGAGACLYIIPSEIRLEFKILTTYFNAHSISHAILTPSVIRKLEPKRFGKLRVLLTTGEAVTGELISTWRNSNRNLSFFNGYGPAEVTIATSMSAMEPGEPVHIGQPIQGLKIYILEQKPENRLAPQWANENESKSPGEIYIAGDGVGQGYLDTELTDKRFYDIQDPDFPNDKSRKVRVFQTRDAGYYRQHGAERRFYFLGRLDRQFKLDSKTICSEEVEGVLAQTSLGVFQAYLAPSDGHFTAYLQVASKENFDLHEYFFEIRDRLVPLLIPKKWVITEEGFYNTSAKTDFKQVQTDNAITTRLRAPSQKQLSNKVEDAIAEIWRHILKIDKQFEFHADDDFFILGATSMETVDLLVLINDKFDVQISMVELHFSSTVSGLARLIFRKREQKPEKRLEELTTSALTTSTDVPLFLIHSLLGDPREDYLQFGKLIENWPSSRRIFGIQTRGFANPYDMDTDLYAIANDYINSIKKEWRGPYLLGGWSAGGVIASVMCQILQARNESAFLHMIDSEAPSIYHKKSRAEFADLLLELFTNKLRKLLDLTSCPISKDELLKISKESQVNVFFDALASQVKESEEKQATDISALVRKRLGRIATIRGLFIGILHYQSKIRVTNATMWVASSTQKKHSNNRLGWSENEIQFSNNDLINLDGNHESLLTENSTIKSLARKLSEICDKQIEDNATRPIASVQSYSQCVSAFFNNDHKPKKIRCNLPPNNTEVFVGRYALKDHVIGLLRDAEYGVRILLHGVAGVGKTEFARYFVHNHISQYELIAWLPGESIEQLNDGFIQLYKMIYPDVADKLITAAEARPVVVQWLEDNPHWLIVFDNIENINDINSFLPSQGGKVIVTSRYCEKKHFDAIEITPFSTEDSIALIEKLNSIRINHDERADWVYLVNKMLGNLPLAIVLAAAYIRHQKSDITIKEYINKLSHPVILEEKTEHSISKPLFLSAMKLKEESSQAYRILQLCVYLHADNISYSIVQAMLEKDDEFEKIKRILVKYSLVHENLTKTAISIHRLTRQFIQSSQTIEQKQETVRELILIVSDKDKISGYENRSKDTFSRLIELLPHALSIVNHAQDIGLYEDKEIALCTRMGPFLNDWRDLENAKKFLERALAIRHHQGYTTGPKVRGVYRNLLNYYLHRGNIDELLRFREENSEHLDELGKADICARVGEVEEAERIYCTMVKKDPPLGRYLLAEIYRSLAELYYMRPQPDLLEAGICCEKALNLYRVTYQSGSDSTTYSADNADVADVCYWLGMIKCRDANFRMIGVYNLEQAYKIYSSIYSASHLECAKTQEAMGNAYSDLNELAKSVKCFIDALSTYRVYSHTSEKAKAVEKKLQDVQARLANSAVDIASSSIKFR